MSSCEQIGATVRVPVCLADQINVEGLQVLLQIYLLWFNIQSIFILKYHIHACTFSIPVCSPIKCYLKCQSNGHLYNFTTFINENKIHFSDTVKVNKKS